MRTFIVAGLATLAVAGLSACTEKTQDKIENAGAAVGDDVSNAVDTAGDKIDNGLDKAGDKIEVYEKVQVARSL